MKLPRFHCRKQLSKTRATQTNSFNRIVGFLSSKKSERTGTRANHAMSNHTREGMMRKCNEHKLRISKSGGCIEINYEAKTSVIDR